MKNSNRKLHLKQVFLLYNVAVLSLNVRPYGEGVVIFVHRS